MTSRAATNEADEAAAPFYDRLFLSLINDPRDLPMLHLMVGCLFVVACGVGLFFAGQWFWYLAPVYLVVWGAGFLDRFILMLHCTSHRILFKKKYGYLNRVIPWVIGPFFGETPDTYFVHHMGMHHPENNLQEDLSSTMKYERSSFLHWLHYFGSFILIGLPSLARYHYEKGNHALFRRLIVGEIAFWTVVTGLFFVDWRATLVVLAGPVVFVRLLMMMGNWGQHAFVCKDQPGNPYRNSVTCINTRYNRRCFNDGYHIHHHVKPRAHFLDLAVEFESNRERYGRQDAIVFDGLDFFLVWLLLMVKAWGTLAKHFVQLPGAPERNRDGIIAFLKERTRPIRA